MFKSVGMVLLLICITEIRSLNITAKDTAIKNGTDLKNERSIRDSGRFTTRVGHSIQFTDDLDDFRSFQQKPRKTRLRRTKPKGSNRSNRYRQSDDENFRVNDGSYQTFEKERDEYRNGYEDYFKHENIGNVGKIFDQKDINDFYLNGNQHYASLVNSYLRSYRNHEAYQRYLQERQQKKRERGNRDEAEEYLKKYLRELKGKEEKRNQNAKETIESDEDGYKTIITYDKKDIFGRFPLAKSEFENFNSYDGLKDSYGDFIGALSSNKDVESVFDKDTIIPYGQKIKSTSYFSAGDAKDYGGERQTEDNRNFNFDNYASQFNFDTKPFPEIEPTKYSIPENKQKKNPPKNNDYVSEFDGKGNPIAPLSVTDYDDSNNSNKFSSEDFAKIFYDFNKPGNNYFNNYEHEIDFQPEATTPQKSYASGYDYANHNPFMPDPYVSSSSYQQDQQYYGESAGKAQPIIVPVPQPYPVRVPIAKPVAVPIVREIKVPVEKVVPYPVVKNVPYPVEKRVPVQVEKQVTVHVPQPYPVKIPVIQNVYHHSKQPSFQLDAAHEQEYGHKREHDFDIEFEHEDTSTPPMRRKKQKERADFPARVISPPREERRGSIHREWSDPDAHKATRKPHRETRFGAKRRPQRSSVTSITVRARRHYN